MNASDSQSPPIPKKPPNTRASIDRVTVDLESYPEMVVVYLGMRVRRLRGVLRLAGLGPQIHKSSEGRPDGLLHHEEFIWSLFPLHAGIRQYWRDYDSLERWTRSEPHRNWWRDFFKDARGTGFWHETYLVGGRAEAVYDGVGKPIGFACFAPRRSARGAKFSSRQRAGRAGPQVAAPVVAEADLYHDADSHPA
jgi:hypothetical protein